MKRLLLIPLIVILAVGLVLSSCGDGKATPAPAPAPAPAPTPSAPLDPTGAPKASHGVASPYDRCLLCHETGFGGEPIIPDNHKSYTEDLCAGCHE